MGPRQTAVNNKLRVSTGSRSESGAGRASAKTLGTGVCERSTRGGARCGPRIYHRSSRPVVGGLPTAKTGFVYAEPAPSRVAADRGADQDIVGSHLATTLFSLRLRVAQHFTYGLAAKP
jgi:hypothetical protein